MIRTVTADPGPVFPNGATGAGESSDTVVFNTGSTTVYVDSDFTVTPGTGIPVRAGSNITWAAGVPLYAVTDPGNTGTLAFNDGAGAMFDAGGVANQLIAQGLAGQIAAQIAVSGAPPIDVNAVILSTSFPSVAGTDKILAALDVSRYQSLSVRVSEVDTSTGAPVARQVEMDWLDTSGTNQRDTDGFAITGTNNAATADAGIYGTYQTPVRGPDMQLRIRGNSKAGTTINVTVTGSYKSLASPRYVMRSAYWNSAGNDTFSGKAFDNFAGFYLANTPGNTTRNFYPPVKSGQAEFTWDAQGPSTAGIQVVVQDLDSGIVLYNSGQQVAPGSAGSVGAVVPQTTSLIIPNRPLQFWVQTSNNAVTAAWQFVRGSLSFLDHS